MTDHLSPETRVDPATPPKAVAVAVALLIVYVVWGSTYLGVRIVVAEMPPLTAMGLRFSGAGLLLAGLLAAARGIKRLRLTPRQVLGTAFLGLWLPFLGNGMVSIAISHGATSGLAALLNSIAPLVIVLFRVLERDIPRKSTVAGVVLGLVGLSILLLPRDGDSGTPVGPALLIVVAATCWAVGSYLQPRLWIPKDPFVVAVWEMIWGGAMMLTVGAALGERLSTGYSNDAWAALAYLVVFGAGIGYTAYIWLIANAPISLVTTYAYVNPLIAVFLGWLILEEAITIPMAVGGGVVLSGIALVVTAESRRSTTAATHLTDPVT